MRPSALPNKDAQIIMAHSVDLPCFLFNFPLNGLDKGKVHILVRVDFARRLDVEKHPDFGTAFES
jgi:hypothetical protein